MHGLQLSGWLVRSTDDSLRDSHDAQDNKGGSREEAPAAPRAHPAEVPEGRVPHGLAVADVDRGRRQGKAPLAP